MSTEGPSAIVVPLHDRKMVDDNQSSMEKTIGGTVVRKNKMTLQEMLNFKGNLNVEEESAEPRYTCKETGAHFEFENICSRIEKMMLNREMKKLVMLSASSIGSQRKSSIDTKKEDGE